MNRFTKETAAAAGRKSAARLSPQEHERRGTERGTTTLMRHGVDYFKAIRKKRTRYQQKRAETI